MPRRPLYRVLTMTPMLRILTARLSLPKVRSCNEQKKKELEEEFFEHRAYCKTLAKVSSIGGHSGSRRYISATQPYSAFAVSKLSVCVCISPLPSSAGSRTNTQLHPCALCTAMSQRELRSHDRRHWAINSLCVAYLVSWSLI